MEAIAQEAIRHARYLVERIGSRVIGSPGNHAAEAYIAQHFAELGLPVTRQDFECPDWREKRTFLTLGSEPLEAYANSFSPSCQVSAATVGIGTLAELRQTDLGGKVVVLYGDLTQHEIAAKGAIYVSERDRELVALLENGRPAAVITVNPSQSARWRILEDFDLQIPSVTVPARTGLKLLQKVGENVQLEIHTTRTPSRSANVLAHRTGPRPGKIVLCAHYDTKVDTPGAYDNAAGAAALLTLATQLAKRNHAYTLEFVAFSGEEIYGLGDMTYAHHLQDDWGSIQAALNFDGVGPRLAVNTLAAFAASVAFEDLADEQAARYPGVVRVDPWPASDHYIFYSHGVPSLAFTSLGIKDIYHTPADTLEWLSPEKIAEAVCLAQDILTELQTKEPGFCRPS